MKELLVQAKEKKMKNTGESMKAINCSKVVGKRREIICLPQPGGKHKK